MTIKVNIPFDDSAQHLFDPTKMKVANGVGGLANQYPDSEVCYFNFSEDGIIKSARGNLDMEFFGNDNNGEVINGVMELGIKSDASSARIEGIVLSTPDVLQVGFNFINQIPNFTLNKEIFRVTNSDGMRIRFYLAWVGGGEVRLTSQVNEDAIHTVIIDTYDLIVGDRKHLAFCIERGGDFKTFVDGDLVSTVDASLWNIKLGTIDIVFGEVLGIGTTAFDYDNFQLSNEVCYAGASTVDTGELYSRPRTYQEMITVSPLLVQELTKYEALYRNYNSLEEFRHVLLVDNVYMWFKIAEDKWLEVRDKETDINTAQEIHDNRSKLQIQGGNGAFIQQVLYLKSIDGYSDPQITDYNIDYIFAFSLGAALPRCKVIVEVIDEFGQPVEGAEVVFTGKDYFHGDTLVAKTARGLTGANGKAAVAVVETETVNQTRDCYVRYTDTNKDGVEGVVENAYKRLTIPNLAAQTLRQIRDDSAL